MHDVDDEEKVFHLCHHSKKLVVASRLINTTPSTPLWIMKNWLIYEDCHTSIKFISKLVGRAIMMKDANSCDQF
jgi:hypothetical protein